jgi:5-formyltetrahydrofolate cyclo-ligase|tara:strand:- start:100 stop:645 length:546 start_codon:yes stop_codon:yes gene_type:complete
VSKESLRKKFIKIRKTKFVNQNINFNEFKKILHTLRLKKIKNIGGYYPINSEIGCLNILEKLEKNNFKISLPITKKDNNMDFYQWSFNDSLKVSYRGIPEPAKKKKVYPDILIVPLVAFDKDKYRLGYGGGFYDRYIYKILKLKKVLTIGFGFSFQELKKIPINKFDQKLDLILTDKGVKI